MLALVTALGRAVGQLPDPAILKVIAKSIVITVLLLFALGVLGGAFAEWLAARYNLQSGSQLGLAVTALLIVVGAWLLFRIIALAVLQFFGDDIVRAVEAQYYPQSLDGVRTIPFNEEMGNSIRSVSRALLVNAVALVLAIPLLFTAIGPAIVFFIANAWLLGYELQDLVWLPRRQPGKSAKPIGGIARFVLGAVVAGLLVIPFVNLFAPVIGAAAATHLFHSRKERVQSDHAHPA